MAGGHKRIMKRFAGGEIGRMSWVNQGRTVSDAFSSSVNVTRTPAQRLCVAQRIVASAARRRAREGKSAFSRRPSLAAKGGVMEILHRRCAGLDVYQKSISACIRMQTANSSKTEVLTRVFGTFTDELEQLRDWLREQRVHAVAMESTGVYWVPVWNVLERGNENWFELLLINPQHVHALPGRKTDQQDCERIAELLQYGLLRGSFIPARPIRQLRDLTRRRAHVQQDRNRVINRIGRLLETANCKLASVVSDIVGKTGTLILQAIARGDSNPAVLAELAQGSLQLKKVDLARALQGRYTEHFRWLLRDLLRDLAGLSEKIEQLDRRISEQCAPYSELIQRLCTIPTVKLTTAQILLAELGVDMTPFGDGAHAASWAGLCPGNNETAGKRRSGATRKGNRYLRRSLVQNGWAVSRMNGCYLTGVFFRIAARGGMKKAAMAIAHKIVVIAFHVIRDGEMYHELGVNFYDLRRPDKTINRLTRRLNKLGFDVVLSQRPSIAVTPTAVLPEQIGVEKKKKRGRPCLCSK